MAMSFQKISMDDQVETHERRDEAPRRRSQSEELVLGLIGRISIQLQLALDLKLRPLGITAQEAAVLVQCAADRELSATKLASRMSRDKGGVTRHLDRLAKKRLIRRMPSAQDGRLTMVQVTRRGRKLAPQCIAALMTARSQLLAEFFDVEIQQLSGALSRISQRLLSPQSKHGPATAEQAGLVRPLATARSHAAKMKNGAVLRSR